MTDLRSKIFELIIGGNDWTDYATEAVLQWEELDIETGFLKTLATFTLDVSEISPLPTYRTNPTQWAKGVSVTFRCENSAGTLIKPTMGDLFILKEPTPPSISNPILTLECGCVLALLDFDSPDGDLSGIDVGTVTNREAIAASILTGAAATPNLTSIPYPFDYPIPKQGGSYIAQAGSLVGSAGHVIYQNSAGEVVNTAIDIDPSSALLSITIGQDESEWQHQESVETPPEKIVVAGVGYGVDDKPFTETVSETEGTVAEVNPKRPWDDTGLGVIARTTVRTYAYDEATQSERTKTIIEGLKIAIRPNNVTTTDAYDLITTETSDDINYYDAQGRLVKQTCETKKTIAELLPRAVIDWNLSPETSSLTEYEYDGQTIKKLTATKSQYKYGLKTNVVQAIALDLVPYQETVSTWNRLFGETWQYRQAKREYRGKTNPSATTAEFFDLIGPKAKSYTAGDGSANPPATQYLSLNTLEEFPIESTVNFKGLGGVGLSPQPLIASLPYGVSSAQAYELGLLHGGILWGRRFGWSVGMEITDDLLTAPPLSVIDVADNDSIYRLLIDGLTLAFTAESSFARFSGIEIGVAPTSDPTAFTKSYNIVLAAEASIDATATFSATGQATGNVATIEAIATVSATLVDYISVEATISTEATVTATGQTTGTVASIDAIAVTTANGKVT